MYSRSLARILAAVIVTVAIGASVPDLAGPPEPAKPRPDERYPEGWCGSHDDVYQRVRERHEQNLKRLEGVDLPRRKASTTG